MNHNTIKISVIIPTYNRIDLLRKCLDSLFVQTYPRDRFEIIIIDDGSNDGTEEMIRGFQKVHANLRYWVQDHKGPAVARNRGVKEARGEILGLLDSDCLAVKDYLQMLDDFFSCHPDIGACGAPTYHVFPDASFLKPLESFFWERMEERKRMPPEVSDRVQGPWTRLCTDSCGIRKKAFQDIGGFDSKFSLAGEDPDFWYKMVNRGHKIALTWHPLAYHHQRASVWKTIVQKYKFGISDVVNYKDHFRNRFIFVFPAFFKKKPIVIENFPVTFFVQFYASKIIFLILLLGFWWPLVSFGLLALYFASQYRKTRSLSLSVRLITYLFVNWFSVDLGRMVGTIRYRTICL